MLALIAGGVVVALLLIVLVTTSGKSSSNKNTIPEEFRTPFGCDSRLRTGFCEEEQAIYRACNVGVTPDSKPETGQDPETGAAASTWYRDGSPIATMLLNGQDRTMTIRTTDCEVVVPLSTYMDLDYPGPEEKLPPEFR